MKKIILLSILLISSTCSGIAQKKGKLPVWIDQPYKAYDKSEYLLAVGNGADLQAAQNNGMMNLSRIFQADVKADQRLLEEIREISKNGKLKSVDDASQLLTNIKVGTNQQIKNAKLLESYTESDGRATVLIGIERKPTARLYSAEIESNESEISAMMTAASNEQNPVRKLTKYQQAFVLAKINTTLITQREVILERPAMSNENESLIKTREAVSLQKRQTKIAFKDTDLNTEIKASIQEELQKEGFEFAENQSEAAIILEPSFISNSVDLGRDDAKFVKWTLLVNVIDSNENRTFFTYQAENRDGALTDKEAHIRAVFNAKKQLKKDFAKKLSTQLLTY